MVVVLILAVPIGRQAFDLVGSNDPSRLGSMAEAGASTVYPGEPEPTADPGSLSAVRDTILAIVRPDVPPGNPAIRISHAPARIGYRYAHASAQGWRVEVSVADSSGCPHDLLETRLKETGWVEAYGYSADGPDGMMIGLICKRFLCIIEAYWDGGDDSDSRYVPQPGCTVTVSCLPRRRDDVPQY